MKNQNINQDWKDSLVGLTEDVEKRKSKFINIKKGKQKQAQIELLDEDRQGLRSKLKNVNDQSFYDQEWDDDDEALYKWRRGKVGSEPGPEKDDNA